MHKKWPLPLPCCTHYCYPTNSVTVNFASINIFGPILKVPQITTTRCVTTQKSAFLFSPDLSTVWLSSPLISSLSLSTHWHAHAIQKALWRHSKWDYCWCVRHIYLPRVLLFFLNRLIWISLSFTGRSFSDSERGVNSVESFRSGHQRKLTSRPLCQLEALTTQTVQTTKAHFHGQLDAVKAAHCIAAGMWGRWFLPLWKIGATSLGVGREWGAGGDIWGDGRMEVTAEWRKLQSPEVLDLPCLCILMLSMYA